MTEVIKTTLPIDETKANRLPEKASDLIELAIADLAKAKRSKKYRIDMGVWHVPGRASNNTCTVCLAGSVMAYSLAVALKEKTSPYAYEENDPHTYGRLMALNEFRNGWIEDGLEQMGIYPLKDGALEDEARRIQDNWNHYENNTVGWHRCMRETVELLRKHNL